MIITNSAAQWLSIDLCLLILILIFFSLKRGMEKLIFLTGIIIIPSMTLLIYKQSDFHSVIDFNFLTTSQNNQLGLLILNIKTICEYWSVASLIALQARYLLNWFGARGGIMKLPIRLINLFWSFWIRLLPYSIGRLDIGIIVGAAFYTKILDACRMWKLNFLIPTEIFSWNENGVGKLTADVPKLIEFITYLESVIPKTENTTLYLLYHPVKTLDYPYLFGRTQDILLLLTAPENLTSEKILLMTTIREASVLAK